MTHICKQKPPKPKEKPQTSQFGYDILKDKGDLSELLKNISSISYFYSLRH